MVTSVITQATCHEKKLPSKQRHLPDLLKLSLRGTRIDMDRDIILTLPESILMVMFPHGFALDSHDGEHTFCQVDFSYIHFSHLLHFFDKARKDFKKTHHEFTEEAYLAHAVSTGIPLNPLLTKQGIIVLREELEYFVVVLDKSPCTSQLKQQSGQWLVERNHVFEALLQNIQHDASEQHLVDMLCTAGFSTSDHWQQRDIEPNKTSVVSLSLVTLNQKNRLYIGQKLMMFYKKPARKCWWTKTQVKIDKTSIHLWSRRTWTLELVLV